jgi:Ca2+/H+ antiporter
MQKNMGQIDRIVRVILALIMAALYFTGQVEGLTGTIMLVLAAVFTLTSFVSFCPLYAPFGINTDAKKQQG